MIIDTKQLMTITEVNQNFSRAARAAGERGGVVIFKNNKPRYLLVDLNKEPYIDLTPDEKIDIIAKRVLEKYRSAFEELAK